MKISQILIPALVLSSLSLSAQKSTKPFGTNLVQIERPNKGSVQFNNNIDPNSHYNDQFTFVNCWITPMHHFNSNFPEYTPILAGKTNTIYFTTRRPENTGNKKTIDPTYKAEDIYFSTKDSEGKWSPAKGVHGHVNTMHNEAVTWVSADGKRMILCKNEDLFESTLVNGEWSKPTAIDMINSTYRETHASYSTDGNILFFTTNDPALATVGGMDICMVKRDESTGSWGTPTIVEGVNSTLNEEDPTLMADNKTLYFTSQGFSTLGGYDIFKSSLTTNGFSSPVNVGFPVNTEANEPFISFSQDGKKAFLSSDRGDTKEQNIYEITFLDHIKVPLLIEVYDAESNQLINSDIQLADVKTSNKEVYMDNVSRGVFAAENLNLGTHYTVKVSSNDHASQDLVISTSGLKEFDPDTFLLVEKVYLTPIKKDKVVPTDLLNNIVHFDFGKTTLTHHSLVVVEKLKEFLLTNPDANIVIHGHTDNVGSNEANLILSHKRGNAVLDWFVANGINANRISVKGFGEEKPSHDNETELTRAKNRRAEIEIVFIK